jgi:EpsI family protein
VTGPRYWTVIVLLLAGALAAALPRAQAPVAPPQLQLLPQEISGWSSEDVPIEPRLVEASKVDAYLSRVYRHAPLDDTGRPAELGVYVGFYGTQRAGDSVHSPKNCLPGAGWQPVHAARIALPLASGAAMANLYVVENERQRFIVLYWYQSHGRIIASEYRAKLYTLRDALVLGRTDSTLVRITVPVSTDEAAATRTAMTFATLLAPRLEQVLPR